jgi:hypothetical protein
MSETILDPQFPRAWDSTIHSAWKTCKRKFFERHVLGFRSMGNSIHLVAGGAFASGVEATRKAFYGDGLDPELAIGKGLVALALKWGDDPLVEPEHPKSMQHMADALVRYFDKYRLGEDRLRPMMLGGKPAVECNFAFPLDVKHPVTGEPILYCGRFDMLAEDDGIGFGVDEKTTGQLGPTWGNKWDLRAQFTGYTLGARTYGVNIAGFVVRGIALYKNDIGFAEAIVQRPQWMIDEWLEGLHLDIADAIRCYEMMKFPKVFDDACAGFSGCAYLRLCTTPDPEPFRKVYYEHDRWDPLDFGKEGD